MTISCAIDGEEFISRQEKKDSSLLQSIQTVSGALWASYTGDYIFAGVSVEADHSPTSNAEV